MKRASRLFIYTAGMLILAAGITLNTKTGLGVSPIISVAYSVSAIWGVNFGWMTTLLYLLFVIAQLFLRKKEERAAVLYQIAVSVIFGNLLNWFSKWIPYDSACHGLASNLGLLALAIALTGIGVSMTVNMRLVPNPGDGIVQAIAARAGWELGLTKNIFDLGCVAVTILLGLVFAGRVVGISIGTLLAMLGVGRAVALTNRLFREKMRAAAGLAEGGEEV